MRAEWSCEKGNHGPLTTHGQRKAIECTAGERQHSVCAVTAIHLLFLGREFVLRGETHRIKAAKKQRHMRMLYARWEEALTFHRFFTCPNFEIRSMWPSLYKLLDIPQHWNQNNYMHCYMDASDRSTSSSAWNRQKRVIVVARKSIPSWLLCSGSTPPQALYMCMYVYLYACIYACRHVYNIYVYIRYDIIYVDVYITKHFCRCVRKPL